MSSETDHTRSYSPSHMNDSSKPSVLNEMPLRRMESPTHLNPPGTLGSRNTSANQPDYHPYHPDRMAGTGIQSDRTANNISDDLAAPGSIRPLGPFLYCISRVTPSFYAINMGTGITSILLYNFPYPAVWLERLGIVIFALNVVLFALISLATVCRYVLFPGLFGRVARHRQTGMFWGCLAMGFATIVNMVAFVLAPINIHWARLALGLWWIDVVMSVVINLGLIIMIFTRQHHDWDTVSAAWLLPVVASVVAAASGGVVGTALAPYDPRLARSTLIVAYVVWGTGVPLAMMFITVWIIRCALVGLPASSAMTSMFLPLGPCGQGSFGILIMGKGIRTLAYTYSTPFAEDSGPSAERTADVAWAFGVIVGLILWGLGLCFYLIAHVTIIDHVINKERSFFNVRLFSMGMWSLTFPLGVFATATYQLATDLQSEAFRVIGAFQAVQLVLYWLYVSSMTAIKIVDRTIFIAAELDGRELKRRW